MQIPYSPVTDGAGGYPNYAAMALAEQRMRVRRNLQPLGIAWIVLGILGLIRGALGAFVLHHMLHDGGGFDGSPSFLHHLLGRLVPVIAFSSTVLGIIGVGVGWGLLTRQPWARVLAMIFGIVSLIKVPFGTALGIYTLWVLGSGTAAVEWDAISAERTRVA